MNLLEKSGVFCETDNHSSNKVMIGFDIVKDIQTKDIYIENVRWILIVIHYEVSPDNVTYNRFNHQIYKMKRFLIFSRDNKAPTSEDDDAYLV